MFKLFTVSCLLEINFFPPFCLDLLYLMTCMVTFLPACCDSLFSPPLRFINLHLLPLAPPSLLPSHSSGFLPLVQFYLASGKCLRGIGANYFVFSTWCKFLMFVSTYMHLHPWNLLWLFVWIKVITMHSNFSERFLQTHKIYTVASRKRSELTPLLWEFVEVGSEACYPDLKLSTLCA